MTTDGALRRIDAVMQVGLRLARSAPSGRVLLARIADGIDVAWIPRPWGDEIATELDTAQASAGEPVNPRRIEQALRDAWGTPPGDELDDLDLEPVAVTPSSQVHRGVLDGASVAVKVLRPGLARSVRQDLALLDALLGPLGAAFPALDARAIVREVRERVLDELDLEQEAAAQRRFHRGLRGHRSLAVPAPIMRLTHAGVLVSEWVEGVPLWDAPDRDRAAAQLVQFALGGATAGIAHADLHPDDVLVLPDGRLAVLDFGAWCDVDPDRVALATAAFHAFLARDVDAFARTVDGLGWLPASRAAAFLDTIERALGPLAGPGPVRLDGDSVLAARDRLIDDPAGVIQMVLHGALSPQDLWPARSIAQLFGTIARVGATGDWRELISTALRDGWNAADG
jgi:predicted unusual protein kinase regulating ubiquinone biosynthesis (AarF/ABC1/UbiB family)